MPMACAVTISAATPTFALSWLWRLREDKEKKDIFFFDNGDVVDGTGLSSATDVDGLAVLPLLAKMPYDALNCGNHELYQSSTVLDGLIAAGAAAGRSRLLITGTGRT